MAKRKSRKRRAVKCKRVRVQGKTRRMCWGPKGKLVSNKGTRRKKARKRRRR